MAHEPLDDLSQPAQSAWQRFNRARDRGFEWLERSYSQLLEAALERRVLVLGAFLTLIVNALVLAQVVGTDFFPEVDSGQMKLHVRAPLGLRIEDTEALVADIEREIRDIIPKDELVSITDNLGIPTAYNLAFVQTDNLGGQDAEIQIALSKKHGPTRDLRRRIRTRLAETFVGTHAYFQPADIISQVLNFGLSAPIDVEIEGPNLETSATLALKLREAMRVIPGVVDTRILQAFNHPALEVEVDRERAAQLGLSQLNVAQSLLTSLSGSGLVAPSFWLNPQNSVNYLVAVQTPLASLQSVDALLGTPLSGSVTPVQTGLSPQGPNASEASYLASVARLKQSQTPSLISHDLVQRVVDVQCGIEDRDLGAVARDIKRAIDGLGPLPAGHAIHVRGQSESMNDSFFSLGMGVILAAFLVYLLMVVLFQSWIDPFIIMAAVPGALTGVVMMLGLTHTSLNVESLMGMIMAIGVAVSNSILLVHFANEVREHTGVDAMAAAREAGRTRLRPVLMTALAMVLGMIPMALGLGEGGEQNAPLGRAVIGGLCVATIVTLFVVPIIYTLMRRSMPALGQLDAHFERDLAAG